MAVYRFRVTFEDNEEVYRDIDIRSSQTFYDFHTTILSSIGFEDNSDSSFFISDDMWRRSDEVALNPPTEADNKRNKKMKVAPPKYIMKKCKMAALIDDPHQKFIYVHDPNNTWTFMVELMKIVPDDVKVNYPICSKSIGIAPQKNKTPIIPPDILDDLELDELDEHHETEAYTNASEGIDIDELDEGTIDEVESEAEEDVLEESDENEFEGLGDGEESLLDED